MHQSRNIAPLYVRPASQVSLPSAFAFIKSNTRQIILAGGLVGLLGISYAILAAPVFQASALIKVDSSAPDLKRLPDNLTGIFEVRATPTAELEMMRSRSVLAKVVDDLDLNLIAEPRRIPLIGAWLSRRSNNLSTPWYGLTHGSESMKVKAFEVPRSMEGDVFKITLQEDGKFILEHKNQPKLEGKVGALLSAKMPTGNLGLLIQQIDAAPGAQFELKKLSSESVIDEIDRGLNIKERGKQSGVISVSLEGKDPVLVAAIVDDISKQYIQQNINLKTEEAERSLLFVESQLPGLRAAIENAETRYSSFRNGRGTVDVSEESRALLQQTVQTQVRLTELRQKRDELLVRYQVGNPFVEAVTSQIGTLTGEVASINEKIKRIPGTEQDLVRFTRDIKVNTELYTALLNTAQQLRLVKASSIGSAKLIDKAVPQWAPVGPKRLFILIVALVGGFVFGLIAAVFRSSLVNTISSAVELKEQEFPALSIVIPDSQAEAARKQQKTHRLRTFSLLSELNADDPAVESLRAFRSVVVHGMTSAANNIALIVGPTTGVGITFVAENLSALLARSTKRVLLIDGDLRRGHLHRHFDMERGLGLSDVLDNRADLLKVINSNIIPNLDFISAGTLSARAADLLSRPQLAELLTKASQQYEFVLIDSPPILEMADALILAEHAGLIYCVVRKSRSTLVDLNDVTSRLANIGKQLAGTIYNQAIDRRPCRRGNPVANFIPRWILMQRSS